MDLAHLPSYISLFKMNLFDLYFLTSCCVSHTKIFLQRSYVLSKVENYYLAFAVLLWESHVTLEYFYSFMFDFTYFKEIPYYSSNPTLVF